MKAVLSALDFMRDDSLLRRVPLCGQLLGGFRQVPRGPPAYLKARLDVRDLYRLRQSSRGVLR